ncbi:MAG: aldo/keto reductase [Gammaproteobacteria bacterium]|nr:aldo/keto reductase [Gammaproteobacteria bacterium]
MSKTHTRFSRRRFLNRLIAAAMMIPVEAGWSAGKMQKPKNRNRAVPQIIRKTIPSTGESIPVIGMGSWLTFDVGDDIRARNQRIEVLQAFFDKAGAMIDSSPMYGSSQEVLGYCLARIDNAQELFAATKVWVMGKALGQMQMAAAEKLWGVARFDLMQIHNMLSWETHLETLKQMKAEGGIRYIGITTSHGRRHREMEKVLSSESFDFVQLTYNVADREAEKRLLPLAREKGIAVIANRPFQRGDLFDAYGHKPLPEWAAEIDCQNWAQFFLKFIVSHPAVTCAIPATTRVDHMHENMGAAYGRLPDAAMRQRMAQYLEKI